jgi:hypothetical protein
MSVVRGKDNREVGRYWSGHARTCERWGEPATTCHPPGAIYCRRCGYPAPSVVEVYARSEAKGLLGDTGVGPS